MGKGSGNCDGRGAIALPALHVPTLTLGKHDGYNSVSTIDGRIFYSAYKGPWETRWRASADEKQRCKDLDILGYGKLLQKKWDYLLFQQTHKTLKDAQQYVQTFCKKYKIEQPTKKYTYGATNYGVQQAQGLLRINKHRPAWDIRTQYGDEDIINILDEIIASANKLSHYHLQERLSKEEQDAIREEFKELSSQRFATRKEALDMLQAWVNYQLSK